MARLKITFEQMFLLVRRTPNPVVLLPTGDTYKHDLYILGTETPLKVCQGDISIGLADLCDGPTRAEPAVSSCSVKWPDEGFVLYVNNLVAPGTRPTVKSELLREDVFPPSLNARVTLPNGKFDWGWNMSEYGEARWQVGPKWNNHQLLTDVLQYECELGDERCICLVIKTTGDPIYVPLQSQAGDDISLTFVNRDQPSKQVPKKFGESTLKLMDFQEIYNLLDSATSLPLPKYYGPGPATSRPPGGKKKWHIEKYLPVGCVETAETRLAIDILSDTDPERPICGGAQGDPP